MPCSTDSSPLAKHVTKTCRGATRLPIENILPPSLRRVLGIQKTSGPTSTTIDKYRAGWRAYRTPHSIQFYNVITGARFGVARGPQRTFKSVLRVIAPYIAGWAFAVKAKLINEIIAGGVVLAVGRASPGAKSFSRRFLGGMVLSHLTVKGVGGAAEQAATGAVVAGAPRTITLPPIPGIGVALPFIFPWFGIGGFAVTPKVATAAGVGSRYVARGAIRESVGYTGLGAFVLGAAAGIYWHRKRSGS